MASFAAMLVSKKILGETLQNKFGTEVPASRLDGRPTGKVKKRKKALPPGISKHDGQVLTKVKRRAYRLDLSLCNFLGIHFGWSSLVALVPAIGDVLDTFITLMVFKTCCQVDGGLPASLKLRMLVNIGVDFTVGLIPFLGDLADAMFKANMRNCLLLEQHLRDKGKTQLRKSGLPIPAIDPSSLEEFDRVRHESPGEHRTDSRSSREPANVATAPPSRDQLPRAPDQARIHGGGAWLGRNQSHLPDVEMGLRTTGSTKRYHQGKSDNRSSVAGEPEYPPKDDDQAEADDVCRVHSTWRYGALIDKFVNGK